MAVYSIIRRVSDNMVVQPQRSRLTAADPSVQEDTAAARYGGTWEYVEVSQAVYADVVAAITAGKMAFYDDATVTTEGPPVLSYVENTTSITVTCDVEDAGFTGTMYWECTSPDGETASASGPATAGVDSWQINTGQQGTYQVRVEVPGYGFASLEFEGI